MKIHKEGYATIGLSFFVLVIASVLLHFFIGEYLIIKYCLDAIFIVLFLLIVYFFRSPNRFTKVCHEYIISPADGKIVVVEEVIENEYLKDKCKQISIFMSPFNVHCNRYPCSGNIIYSKYHPGSYLVAWHPKSSEENERTTVVVENKKYTILLRQIAGALARRIVCYAVVGESVMQGQELGFIKFGSRVDLFLPVNSKIKVKLGQTVRAGQTVIAEIC